MSKSIWFCILASLMVIGFLALGPKGAYAHLMDGLVSAWLFDEGSGKVLRDSAGKNDGTIHGAKWTDGKFRKALDFDGKDDFVEIPDDKSLHLPMELTVAGWLYIRKGNNHAAWCWKGEGIGWGPNFSWRCGTRNDTALIWGRCVEGLEAYFDTANVAGLNKWFHAAQTADGKVMKVYIDGKIADITDQPGHAITPGPYLVFKGAPVRMGVGLNIENIIGNDFYWDGIIDEVAIWDRALSEDEVNKLMKAQLPLSVQLGNKLTTTWGQIKRK